MCALLATTVAYDPQCLSVTVRDTWATSKQQLKHMLRQLKLTTQHTPHPTHNVVGVVMTTKSSLEEVMTLKSSVEQVMTPKSSIEEAGTKKSSLQEVMTTKNTLGEVVTTKSSSRKG